MVAALAAMPAAAQDFGVEPVFDVQLLPDRTPLVAGEPYRLAVVVTIEDGWHVNSQDPGDRFAVPTTLQWRLPEGWGAPAVTYPEAEEVSFSFSPEPLRVWEGRVVLVASGTVPGETLPGAAELGVTVTAQACNDTQCLPPTPVEASARVEVAGPGTAQEPANAALFPGETAGPRTPADEGPGAATTGDRLSDRLARSSLPLQLGLIFVLGLGLAFTPCVYPLIPITVSFFSQQARDRKGGAFFLALVYVLGIAVTYSSLGVAAALTGKLFGAALQSPLVIGAVVVVLLALAASMFGAWELRVPSWAMNMAGTRTGYLGSLVMGLLVGVVAAPCVGPAVVGLLTYVGQSQDPVLGFALFFALSMGLGLPYLVLGTFTGALNRMPASGAWMIGVRKVFGVLLIALAAYFARPLLADPWGTVVMAAALVLGGLYLLVVDRTGHEQPAIDRVMRLVSAALIVAGVLLLPLGGHQAAPRAELAWQPWDQAAFTRAVEAGEPVIVDFFADWCAPCRELDERTFSDPRVAEALSGFARFKVDLTRSSDATDALRQRFGVRGVPTVMVYRGGRELFRITGFEPPEVFLERLESR